ncbi:492_t:CDS:2 [Rhizophagus irregularis]|nr:492_t:CDS:2 [Rhizophagus irregularis]
MHFSFQQSLSIHVGEKVLERASSAATAALEVRYKKAESIGQYPHSSSKYSYVLGGQTNCLTEFSATAKLLKAKITRTNIKKNFMVTLKNV